MNIWLTAQDEEKKQKKKKYVTISLTLLSIHGQNRRENVTASEFCSFKNRVATADYSPPPSALHGSQQMTVFLKILNLKTHASSG
jgi:hypothetical protein